MTLPTKYAPHHAIIAGADLAESSRKQYIRAIDLLIIANIDPRNREALATYAGRLSPSGKSFLKAALKILSAEQITTLKAGATADNVNEVQALLYNMEAMLDTIKVHTPKGQKAHIWLTPEQVTELTTEATNNNGPAARRDWILLALLLFGLRREEAAALPFDNILMIPDDKGNPQPVIQVTGKGDKGRAVPISRLLYDRLMAWKDEAGLGNIMRAVTREGRINHGLTGKSVYEIVQAYGERIGIKNLQPHDLRRTYGMFVYNNTKDLMLVMTRLGHTKPETTMRYLNLALDLSRDTTSFIPLGE